VDSLKAALKQKTDEVEVIKKQRDRLEQEVNFLRSLHSGLAHAAISVFTGGAQSPGAPESAQFSLPDPSVTEGGSTAATGPERDGSSTESANGNGSGAGTLIHECAVDADEGSLVVAPDNAKLTRMVTFENMVGRGGQPCSQRFRRAMQHGPQSVHGAACTVWPVAVP